MRTRRAFGLTVVAAVAAFGTPGIATAEPAGVLYVNNNPGANCADTGTGTAARPFCTIQAAADVVEPGQTVQVAPGTTYFENVKITRSGTAERPITFLGTPLTTAGYGTRPTVYTTNRPFTLSGVNDVVVRGFETANSSNGISVADSSRVVIDQIEFGDTYYGSDSVLIAGKSDHVTVSRSHFPKAHGVVVQDGAAHTLITSNDFNRAGQDAVKATDAPDLAVTNNTIAFSCWSGVSVEGNSPRALIKNNIITATNASAASDLNLCLNAKYAPLISLSAQSAGTAAVDYNTVHPWSGIPAYSWAGTGYATPTELATATGQGTHDLVLDIDLPQRRRFNQLTEAAAAAIDSADPDAPGVGTDLFGQPALKHPKIAGNGPGNSARDRGAYELNGLKDAQLTTTGTDVPTPQGPAPFTAKLTGSATNDWGAPISSYIFEFGDGSPQVTSTTPSVTHTYTRVGYFSTSVTMVDANGARITGTGYGVKAGEPGPVTATVKARQTGWPLKTDIEVNGGSPYALKSPITVDFGDGTSATRDHYYGYFSHDYSAPGEYTVTATVLDEAGRSGTGTTKIKVAYDPAVQVLQPGERVQVLAQDGRTLLNGGAHYGNGAWAPFTPVPAEGADFPTGSVIGRAVATTSDQKAHNLVVDNYGKIHITDRLVQPNGTWTPWAEVTAPGAAGPLPGIPDQIASATIGNTLHVLALVNGTVYQTTADYAAGRWTGWANVSAATGLGTTTKISAAATGNSLHIATLDSFGRAYIADGNYDRGTWSSGELTAILGTPSGRPANQIAAASTGDKLHVVVLDYGTVRQAIGDYAAGRWTGWNDITAPAGTQIGNIDRIAAAGTGNKLQVYALAGGSLYNATGDYDRGAWAPWASVAGPPGLREVAVGGA
ncbi:PKD domain-containing protein [Kitasatospora sp. NPDC087314]|uniref:PKD domain-containing protein n=1 Tax=Kitasatospora sp. NPDC087314 TaxID=3364068 RepID=UPI003810159C